MVETHQTEVQSEQNPPNTDNYLAHSWTFFIDGLSTKNGSGVGIVLKSPERTLLE